MGVHVLFRIQDLPRFAEQWVSLLYFDKRNCVSYRGIPFSFKRVNSRHDVAEKLFGDSKGIDIKDTSWLSWNFVPLDGTFWFDDTVYVGFYHRVS